MGNKLVDEAVSRPEAERDLWQEVVDAATEIKAGGGKRTLVAPRSEVARIRLKSGLSQADFASALGVSEKTLAQWEQGGAAPSGAAKTLLRIADRHPQVFLEAAA